MAYAPGGAALAGANCPSTHPIRVPQVMYEVRAPLFLKNDFFASVDDGAGDVADSTLQRPQVLRERNAAVCL